MTLKATHFKQFRRHLPDTPGVQSNDPMSEAGRKLLAFHFNKLCQAESHLRKGTDPEAIHDMRVASRRLRSIIALFKPFYRDDALASSEKTLRQVAKRLGTVRDLEVMQAKADTWLAEHPRLSAKGLHVLLDSWRSDTDAARKDLDTLLGSNRYGEFTVGLAKFVMSPGKEALRPRHGESQPTLVRQVAPSAIYEQLAAVRAFEPISSALPLDRLHKLRIEAKRLRYVMESFAEVLSPDIQAVIDATTTLQDYLGNLHDAAVTSDTIQHLIDADLAGKATKTLLAYKAANEAEKNRLLDGVAEAWNAFVDQGIRRALAISVGVL